MVILNSWVQKKGNHLFHDCGGEFTLRALVTRFAISLRSSNRVGSGNDLLAQRSLLPVQYGCRQSCVVRSQEFGDKVTTNRTYLV